MIKTTLRVKMNRRAMERVAQRALSKKQAKELAWQKAQEVSKRAQEGLLQEFSTHPVTQEIEAGPNASNVSGTINGVQGNLFSFIGFSDGANPTEVIRRYISSKKRVYKTSRFVKTSTKGGQYRFRIDAPTMEGIKGITPLPWESGRSWVQGIEQGISGIGHYLYKKSVSGSRSGTAVQIRGSLGGSFSTKPYMKALLQKYKINLRTGALGK